jgi:cyclopropane-fatty-acyl-phospholipid synthase
VLEIGCGWGGFAERAVATGGCDVTGITISRAQLEYARKRLAHRGFDDRARIELRDYRDLEGTFDRIVSIEMLEAVGERWWPTYFRTLRERLVPGGRAALQSIVIAPEAFPAYRATSDFIREYIFPGGMLPTVPRIQAEAAAAGLEVREVFDFGLDYARTLRRWREAFDAREAAVRALGFDDAFIAAWRFYLHYCEAGFQAGRVSVVHVELARAG